MGLGSDGEYLREELELVGRQCRASREDVHGGLIFSTLAQPWPVCSCQAVVVACAQRFGGPQEEEESNERGHGGRLCLRKWRAPEST